MEYQTINLEQIAPTLEAIDRVMGERSLNDRLNYVSYVMACYVIGMVHETDYADLVGQIHDGLLNAYIPSMIPIARENGFHFDSLVMQGDGHDGPRH